MDGGSTVGNAIVDHLSKGSGSIGYNQHRECENVRSNKNMGRRRLRENSGRLSTPSNEAAVPGSTPPPCSTVTMSTTPASSSSSAMTTANSDLSKTSTGRHQQPQHSQRHHLYPQNDNADLSMENQAGSPCSTSPRAASAGHSGTSREARNKAEKHRRDKINNFINVLSEIVPTITMANKRMDKTSILRLAANYLRLIQSGLTKYKSSEPRIRWDVCLKLCMEDVFLLVVLGSGKIMVVTENVERLMGHSPYDLMGQQIDLIVHPSDQERVRSQLKLPADGSTDPVYRCFQCRMSERSLSRTEPGRYVPMLVKGYFRKISSNFSRRVRPQFSPLGEDGDTGCSFNDGSSSSSSSALALTNCDDWALVAVVSPVKSFFEDHIPLMYASHDEYRTRHYMDGTMIEIDQRISTVAGYTVQEVLNLNAFSYIWKEDQPYMQAVYQQTLQSPDGIGIATYRLIAKSGEPIYLRTTCRLEFNRKTQKVETYSGLHVLLSEREGQEEWEKQKQAVAHLMPNYLELPPPPPLVAPLSTSTPSPTTIPSSSSPSTSPMYSASSATSSQTTSGTLTNTASNFASTSTSTATSIAGPSTGGTTSHVGVVPSPLTPAVTPPTAVQPNAISSDLVLNAYVADYARPTSSSPSTASPLSASSVHAPGTHGAAPFCSPTSSVDLPTAEEIVAAGTDSFFYDDVNFFPTPPTAKRPKYNSGEDDGLGLLDDVGSFDDFFGTSAVVGGSLCELLPPLHATGNSSTSGPSSSPSTSTSSTTDPFFANLNLSPGSTGLGDFQLFDGFSPPPATTSPPFSAPEVSSSYHHSSVFSTGDSQHQQVVHHQVRQQYQRGTTQQVTQSSYYQYPCNNNPPQMPPSRPNRFRRSDHIDSNTTVIVLDDLPRKTTVRPCLSHYAGA